MFVYTQQLLTIGHFLTWSKLISNCKSPSAGSSFPLVVEARYCLMRAELAPLFPLDVEARYRLIRAELDQLIYMKFEQIF